MRRVSDTHFHVHPLTTSHEKCGFDSAILRKSKAGSVRPVAWIGQNPAKRLIVSRQSQPQDTMTNPRPSIGCHGRGDHTHGVATVTCGCSKRAQFGPDVLRTEYFSISLTVLDRSGQSGPSQRRAHGTFLPDWGLEWVPPGCCTPIP